MKIKITALAAMAALMLASCAQKGAENTEAADAAATEQPAAEAPAANAALPAGNGEVVTLTDAAMLAPGTVADRLLVVDFNAVWCGPCRQLAPVMEEMAKKYADKATFVSVDIDKYGELMAAYDLGNAIPVVLFIKPDGTREHYVGTGDLLPADKFEALIAKNLK